MWRYSSVSSQSRHWSPRRILLGLLDPWRWDR